MSDQLLLQEVKDHILYLTLNRPEVRNSLNEPLMHELSDAFKAASSDPSIRLIVLTGSGDKAFCSGADLSPSSNTFGFDYAAPTTVYADMLRVARATPVPILGIIKGYCLAGGMGLLTICDMVVASSSAKFGLPEVKVGVFPMQVAALLQSMIPPRKFTEMCYTGEFVDADEALAMGLVNYVVSPKEVDAKAAWLAGRVTDKAPTAIRRGKHALNAIADMTFEQAIAYMESQVGILPLTEDGKEGLAAFAEKRKPVWTGR